MYVNAARRLQRHVEALASDIGGRSERIPGSLERSCAYLETQLRSFGYETARLSGNVEAALPGTGPEIVVVGAHYDTAGGLPGANDNGSGVAATLELAREFAGTQEPRTLRWLFFVNEEPPFFMTPAMGSYVYAARCRQRKEQVVAMISLETIGYYSDRPGSQSYPDGMKGLYPDRGNFLGFVSDPGSEPLLRQVAASFRGASRLPAEAAAAPATLPGVGWSDHWSFWQHGFRAIMVTDTAPFRYPYYHTADDTPDKLDYPRMAEALRGLSAAVRELSHSEPVPRVVR